MDISVYFYDQTTDEQVNLMEKQIAKYPEVEEVKYISKEAALAIWESRDIDEKIKSLVTVDNNPLPRSIEIKATNPEHLGDIAQFLSKEEYKELIRKVDYKENKDIIKKLNDTIEFTRKFGIAISLVFVVISILVILNTIRLTIVTRRDEIEIMRLVGANNLFIRIPFFIEGVLYGIFASIIALIVIAVGFNFLNPFANKYLGDFNINFGQFFTEHIIVITFLLLIVGISLSVICSFISIQKYLKK